MTVNRKPLQTEWPPLDSAETAEQKKVRLGVETEARKVSEMIDKQLELERVQRLKRTGGKILLLGMLRTY